MIMVMHVNARAEYLGMFMLQNIGYAYCIFDVSLLCMWNEGLLTISPKLLYCNKSFKIIIFFKSESTLKCRIDFRLLFTAQIAIL